MLTPSRTPLKAASVIPKSPALLRTPNGRLPMITPYKTGSPPQTYEPVSNESIQEEIFNDMLMPETEIRMHLQSLAEALYKLSTGREKFSHVINNIIKFSKVFLKYGHNYEELVYLYFAAVDCPQDTLLLLLAIGAFCCLHNVLISAKQIETSLEIATKLMSEPPSYSLWGKDQRKPRMKLKEIILIFKGHKFDFEFDFDLFKQPESPPRDVSTPTQSRSVVAKESPPSASPQRSASGKRRRSSGSVRSLSDFVGNDQRKSSISPNINKVTTWRRLTKQEQIQLIKQNKFNEMLRAGKQTMYYADYSERDIYFNFIINHFRFWDDAYESVCCAWDIFMKDDDFDMSMLLTQVPSEYVAYMWCGLHYFCLKL